MDLAKEREACQTVANVGSVESIGVADTPDQPRTTASGDVESCALARGQIMENYFCCERNGQGEMDSDAGGRRSGRPQHLKVEVKHNYSHSFENNGVTSEHPKEPESSPFVPRPLSDSWMNGVSEQMEGFDKQAGVLEKGDGDGSDCPEHPFSSGDDSHCGSACNPGAGSRFTATDTDVADWARVPGDTSITYGARLYLSNLEPDFSHEENCERVLRPILEYIAGEELDIPVLKPRHHIKIEAFVRSVVLSVPSHTWKQSVRGALAMTSPTRKRSGSGASIGFAQKQISHEDMLFRMTLFVQMFAAEAKGSQDADVAVDPMRVEAVVRGYNTNAAEILPLQRPARTLLPRLLFCMACELLSVRLLGPEVRDVCRKIVSDYEARAKLWMTPAQNTESYLRPLLMEFTRWMRSNREVLYQGSVTEGLLRSIDERLRNKLKTQVYRSPEHFLEVLGSLKGQLTDMPLPSYDPSGGDDSRPFEMQQTLKDVWRERLLVNNVPTPPTQCWTVIRDLLFSAAVEETSTENIKDGSTSPATEAERVRVDKLASEGDPPVTARVVGHPPEVERDGKDTDNNHDECDTGTMTPMAAGISPVKPKAMHSTPKSLPTSCSDDAAPEAENTPSSSADCGSGAAAGETQGGDGGSRDGSCGPGGEGSGCKTKRSGLEIYVDQCAWRVLHAASRTASGGDSFFVVHDLFGGEGVLVKISTAPAEPIRIRTKGLAARVTTVDKHDIYHSSDVDISEMSPRPLMTITTIMKEVIQFAPYQVSDSPARPRTAPQFFAEGTALDTATEGAKVQPAYTRSGRFITISASLPDCREDHLEATAGVLYVQEGRQFGMSKFIDHPPGASSCKKSTSTTTAPVTPASTSVYFGGTPTSISGDAASSICTPPSLKPPLLQKSLSESRLLFSQSRGVFSRPSMFTSPPPESERDTSSSGTSESSSSVEIAEEMHSGAAVGSGGGDKAVGRLHTLKLH